jgi:Endonuclease/Exonuclease/phosphatase family
MRILTWNCFRGNYTERFARIEHLKSDVTVLTEACQPKTSSPNLRWAKVSTTNGIAVRVANGFTITPIGGDEPLDRCVHGYHVSGPTSFNLLACWSHDSKRKDYRSPWVNGIAKYKNHLEGQPLVVAGDFNDNPFWDDDGYRALGSFESLLDTFCLKHRLVSAYHNFHGERHGQESRFTHFNNRLSKEYHIDYVFVPKAWRLTEVAIEPRIFDHTPLLIALAD